MTQSCSNIGCTANGTRRCGRCQAPSYCSKLCQKEDWPTHKRKCTAPTAPSSDEVIPCVKIYSQGDGGGRYEDVSLPRSHPIFDAGPLPLSQELGLIKIPLVMTRLRENLPRGYQTDNQDATLLMIDPVSGITPNAWQGGVGSVYVARADRFPLTTVMLATMTDILTLILPTFGERELVHIARTYYDQDRLKKFFVQNRVPQQDYKASL